MAENPSTSPGVVSEADRIGSVGNEARSAQVVLDVYTGVMAGSRNERSAFDAAVRTYRTQNSGIAEDAARLAVARIICRK